MVNKIIIYPKKVIQDILSGDHIYLSKDKWSLISIHSSDEEPLINSKTVLPNNCIRTLSLSFFDCTAKDWGAILKGIPTASKERDLFNKRHAEQIIKFLDSLDIEKILLINCAAGVSRSGAVGLFASRYLKIDEKNFRKTNPNICPNPHIIDILNKISGINDDYIKLWSVETEKNDKLRKIYHLKKSHLF